MMLTALLLSAGPALVEPTPIATTQAPAAQLTFTGQYAAPDEPFSLWSRSPAKTFTEAYPVGNGRIGGTMFAGVPVERIVLNESSLWSGSPQDADRAGASAKLPEIEKLLREGKNVEAEALVNQTFTCSGVGSNHGEAKDAPFGCYQVLGELEMTFLEPDGKPMTGVVKDYRRTLDLKQAAAYVRYEHDKATYTRRMYANLAQQVLVYRIAAGGKSHAISFDARLTRAERAKCESAGADGLLLTGSVSNGKGGEGVTFSARVKGEQQGGTLTSKDGVLSVRGANEVTIVVAMGTSYNGTIPGLWSGPGHSAATMQQCEKALGMGYNELWKEQILQQWKPVFDRSTLELGGKELAKQPTLARLQAVADGANDPQLAALYFDYGRYLLISGTRPNFMPLNLQGLWADQLQTPWNGDFHLNINLQMNYWPAPLVTLADYATPLGVLLNSLVEPGKKTAQTYYGAKGWVAHTITNAWGFTSPGENASWGSSNTCGAWLANQCYDVVQFTQDAEALRKIYPALKGASEFFVDVLVEDPKTKLLVTPVSNSPENAFKLADGKTAHTCMGPTIDQQIVRDLFANTAAAARKLSVEPDFAKLLDEKRAKLAPTRVGKAGQIMEWLEDYEEVEPQHRHVSQLYGLYPSSQINPWGTPELAQAAKITLERRGDAGTGWSMAWKAAMWARLGDGDRALKLLTKLWTPTKEAGFDYATKGGTYENLWCAHPPFQIDGNFGGLAAMAEMLVQSYPEKQGEEITVHLLPALPKAWPNGEVHGLGARGGLNVSIHWKDGKLEHAHIYRGNNVGGTVRIRYPLPLKAKTSDGLDAGGAYQDGVFVFPLEPQKTVEVELAK
ncbi:MAG: glycoside hydrolase family 95 protein [Planctomycetes bacterium]|nr:glycoside hydrolase family 95 protein [Planctomycetota bacterium]